MSTNLEVRLRLDEIVRRAAELSAVKSELADSILQLNQLRKLNFRMRPTVHRTNPARRRMATYVPYLDSRDS